MSVSPDDRIAGSEPIAICGIGLRLPGGIRDAHGFWDLLVSGRDARSVIPASRFAIEGFDASLAGHGAVKTRHGYFLEDDLSRLDASFFSMSRSEVERCDPQQRLLLEVVRECLDDAGEVNYRGQPVGCFVGAFSQDWLEMGAKESQHTGSYTLTGYGDLIIANRVSYEYDLRGPR
jgi:acyl transferase domain-containing protein